MPWYKLAYRPGVLTDLAHIDNATAQRLLDKTKWLASNVGNLRHEGLTSELPGLSQYAVGDWRIFYSIDQSDHIVDVHLVGDSKTLYRPNHTRPPQTPITPARPEPAKTGSLPADRPLPGRQEPRS